MYSYGLKDTHSIRSSFDGSILTLNDSTDALSHHTSNNFLILDRLNQKQQLKLKKQLELKQLKQEEEEAKKIKEKQQQQNNLEDYKIHSHYSLTNLYKLSNRLNPVINNSNHNNNKNKNDELSQIKSAVNLNNATFKLQFHHLQKIEQQMTDKSIINNNYINRIPSQFGVSTKTLNVNSHLLLYFLIF